MQTVIISLFFFLIHTSFSFSQSGSIDSTFNTFDDGTHGNNSGFNSWVMSTTVQPDGKIIVGGIFTSFNGIERNSMARLNENGTLDTTFHIGTGFNNSINAIAIQSNDKIVAGGSFIGFNGFNTNYLTRLNPDGTLDTSFDLGVQLDGAVNTIAIQSDGKIIAGGYFSSYDSITRNKIVRLNTDGTLDTTFNPGMGFNNNVNTITLQSDGKIIAGGNFTNFDGNQVNRIVRLNSNGSIDTSFNAGTGLNQSVKSIRLQSDGKIIIGGEFITCNGMSKKRIVRLNTDGTIDPSFEVGTGFNGLVYEIKIQLDGKIIAVGGFSNYNDNAIGVGIVRLNANGSIDHSFYSGSGFNSTFMFSVSTQSNGKIIVGGGFSSYNGTSKNKIARLLSYKTHTETITSCSPYTWIDGIEYTASNNTATYTFLNGAADGSDSIVTLNLTINDIDTTIYVSGTTLTANQSNGIYQWINCDDLSIPISEGINQSFTPSENGIYAVEITMNGCTKVSDCITINSVGLESLEKNEWTIYPNPNNGIFIITSTHILNNADIEIYSIKGELVYSGLYSGKSTSIKIPEQPAGLYMLRINNQENIKIIKIQ